MPAPGVVKSPCARGVPGPWFDGTPDRDVGCRWRCNDGTVEEKRRIRLNAKDYRGENLEDTLIPKNASPIFSCRNRIMSNEKTYIYLYGCL